MLSDNTIIKMIFGFKIKYLRQQQKLSYEELALRTGLSRSYLHDIEKGRKYPKVDKINALAGALGVSYDFLVSVKASKKLQPIIDLLSSDFIKEFPLEQFGIQPDKLFELFSNTPDKVNAFISTIFNITRHYQMQREHLYLAALRSYQNLYDNYFQELEQSVHAFREEYGVSDKPPFTTEALELLLKDIYSIDVDRTSLEQYKAMREIRSYYSPTKKVLYLNSQLSSAQQNFLLGRELAFQYLELKERPFITRIQEVDSFEKLLNNFQASYFSIALLINEDSLAKDIRNFAENRLWDDAQFLSLLEKYDVTPEMFMQRLTNVLPHHFGIKDLFFIRLSASRELKHYRMTKELHLSQMHNPYANELHEHYCRRWVSVKIIGKARSQEQLEQDYAPIAEAQISRYWDTPNEYLCLSIAKVDPLQGNRPISVTLGLLINDKLRQTFRFLGDPELPVRHVNTTCERCSIPNCDARAAAPVALEKERRQAKIRQAIEKMEGDGNGITV